MVLVYPSSLPFSSLQRNLMRQSCDVELGRAPSPSRTLRCQTDRYCSVLFSSVCLFLEARILPCVQCDLGKNMSEKKEQAISHCWTRNCMVGKWPQTKWRDLWDFQTKGKVIQCWWSIQRVSWIPSQQVGLGGYYPVGLGMALSKILGLASLWDYASAAV